MEKVFEFINTGTYVWFQNRTYIGDWQNNQIHGNGKTVWSDGRCY